MNFDDFTSMQIDGQEITELFIDNVLVWQKNQKTYGNLFATFSGNNVTLNNTYVSNNYPSVIFDDGTYIAKINWGDDYEEVFNGSVSNINHSYEDGLNNHIIKFTKNFEQLDKIFYNCSNLIDITIPLSVTSIGSGCFTGCSGLTSVEIPNSVTSIGNNCFNGCSALTNIVCNWTTNPPTYNSSWINNTPSSLKFSIPYGTTSVYTAAGYPSDKLEERENPTLTLSTEKDIISKYKYYDEGDLEEFASLNITLTGSDKSNKDIIIKANGTQIDTVQTNNKGFAFYDYVPQGNGDIEFTAEYGDLTSNSCNVIDAKYYASNETISSAPSYNNDRTLFASDYTLSEGDKVHFRFKSMPNRCIYGFGSTAGSDFVFEKDGTTLKVWRNVLNNGSYNNPTNYMPSTEYDIVMEFTKYNSSTYRMKLYKDDTYIDYWNCGHSIKKVRVDKFFNDDFEIEAFVL